uniref:Uncharacterized protein n=2 Tax=Picea TaxID=3328 RepID=A0A101M562_PICGL|nr:hypothetical protein ABT39_MTgene1151 [Picea glauca]QHR91710.1 hypothetical protein Q903MT_gene5746 [Picea sitchensis]
MVPMTRKPMTRKCNIPSRAYRQAKKKNKQEFSYVLIPPSCYAVESISSYAVESISSSPEQPRDRMGMDVQLNLPYAV